MKSLTNYQTGFALVAVTEWEAWSMHGVHTATLSASVGPSDLSWWKNKYIFNSGRLRCEGLRLQDDAKKMIFPKPSLKLYANLW